MGLRFFRRVKLAPGITLNLSKSGPSFSFGPRGMKYTVGPRGTRKTFGLPGSGIYYTTSSSCGRNRKTSAKQQQPSSSSSGLDIGFFQSIFTPPEEKQFVEGLKLFLSNDTANAFRIFSTSSSLTDSTFMCGFLALGQGVYSDAERYFSHCQASKAELGNTTNKYMQSYTLSLRITD